LTEAEREPEKMEALTPLGIGRPEDIAYGALYLACDESAYVTASELVIDGGHLAR
jgi:NAD(P)-dependent dehydrogenase (short-subunit alcohol dehydrogenase family)